MCLYNISSCNCNSDLKGESSPLLICPSRRAICAAAYLYNIYLWNYNRNFMVISAPLPTCPSRGPTCGTMHLHGIALYNYNDRKFACKSLLQLPDEILYKHIVAQMALLEGHVGRGALFPFKFLKMRNFLCP
jgi:hypothetical protein